MTQTLGRGLGSLIPGADNTSTIPSDDAVKEIDIKVITPNTQQPRENFDRDSMEALINSIKEHGIIQPLVVVKEGNAYQLIAGERRFRAAKMIGLQAVPAVVRTASEQEKLELALVENVQRQNLNPLEKAYGYHRLIEEFGITQEQVGKRVGQSRAAISNTLRLLTLPTEIQQALRDVRITEGHAKVILGVKDPAEQKKIFRHILDNKLSVRSTEQAARKVTVRKHRRTSKDPNLAAHEQSLEEALGTKVDIDKKGQQGTVRIHFYSADDLKEIIRKITS